MLAFSTIKLLYLTSNVIIIRVIPKNMIIDLTQNFLSLLPEPQKPQPQQPIPIHQSIQAQLCMKQSSEILSSIHKIARILSENKQNYFSNAAYSYQAFTDQQRNQFDRQMNLLLDAVNMKIGELNQVVGRVGFGSTTEKEHLKNMALCLYARYKKSWNAFRDFVEFNQNRKKKLQSMLGSQAKKQYKKAYHSEIVEPLVPPKQEGQNKASADPELEQESKQIYQQRVSQQKKIEQTRKTLEQINGILQMMQNKVLEQELLTSSFREIGQIGLFHIEKGNKNLVDANMISKDSGKLWTMFFLGLAFSLLLLDYLKS